MNKGRVKSIERGTTQTCLFIYRRESERHHIKGAIRKTQWVTKEEKASEGGDYLCHDSRSHGPPPLHSRARFIHKAWMYSVVLWSDKQIFVPVEQYCHPKIWAKGEALWKLQNREEGWGGVCYVQPTRIHTTTYRLQPSEHECQIAVFKGKNWIP